MQVTTSAVALLDALAATALGVYATTIENRETPTSAILLHRARALAGLQARIEDPVKCLENETFLTVFYLLENAARFGNLNEFSTHCFGLHRTSRMRPIGMSGRRICQPGYPAGRGNRNCFRLAI